MAYRLHSVPEHESPVFCKVSDISSVRATNKYIVSNDRVSYESVA